MARFLGAAADAIATGLRTYPGLPHRQQLVATVDGIAFINDSKATNADSAARALGCHDRVIWIAGGEAKEGGIESLAGYFPRIAHTLLIGRDAPILARTLAEHGASFAVAGTLDRAVPAALAAARAHGVRVVLLSPACASWDQFTGFDQRGDRFSAFARSLAGGLR
jgi:UDP-N-acetylmuramoylalanine--D-glutamate ligase